MIECSECGCPYDESRANCPECGNPTPRVNENVGKPLTLNCPNCGAPVTDGVKCEYCGSIIPREIQYKEDDSSDDNNDRSSSNVAVTAGAAFVGGLIGGILSD